MAERSTPVLRTALLHPCFWPEVRRGGERIVHEVATGLIERGHMPRLITSHPGRPSRGWEDGLPVTRHWRPAAAWMHKRGYEDYMTHLPFSYLSLLAGRYDLSHAFFPTDAVAAARWSRRHGRPALFTYLGTPNPDYLSLRRWRLEALIKAVDGASAVTALSQTAADAFRRWRGVEARVIHPGIDLDAFRPREARAEVPTILCAAAVGDSMKRVDVLVAAFHRLRRDFADAELVLISPSDPRLAERVQASGPGIRFVRPVQEPEDVARLYSRAWVSVLASRGESFGLVLAEALACGTPVVGSNHGALPELVDRETIGRLFEVDDEKSLAAALREALTLAPRPETRAECRRRVEHFSVERAVDAYERLYLELLDTGPRAPGIAT
jgi:phosphatidyl-myo-inositol alpha-mannosyltransferase